MKKHYDVIVVGAGAAGIACCEHLHAKGVSFLLLEAKDRIGGRVLAHIDRNVPLELGAEFVHGAPKYSLDWLHRLSIPFYDVEDCHLIKKGRELVLLSDFWDEIGKIMDGLDFNRIPDRSIREFMSQHGSKKPVLNSLFRAYVEGFHAADLDEMGERGLASSEEADDDKLNGSKIFRTSQPYQNLLNGIFQTFANDRNYRPSTVVKTIQWKRDHVTLTCASGRKIEKFTARKLVLTVPLGVLQSNQMSWDPFPNPLRIFLETTHMGHIQKLIFRFRDRFWENLHDKPVSFLHLGPNSYFPTWWSMQPMRLPYLVAWQGGPKALELARLPMQDRIQLAVATLAKLARRSTRFIRSQIEETFTHDWSNDPRALGAYSYVGVGGFGTDRSARCIDHTLFMAGEAFEDGPARGTVHGAFQTGVRAATQVLRNLMK